ncbi:MAG: hypothetical protein ACI4MF_12425 [Candidatus Faecivicinus sp.]
MNKPSIIYERSENSGQGPQPIAAAFVLTDFVPPWWRREILCWFALPIYCRFDDLVGRAGPAANCCRVCIDGFRAAVVAARNPVLVRIANLLQI